MTGASARRTLLVEASDETIDTWINRPYVDDELRDQLSKASVLLVPTEDEKADRMYFPAGTEAFFQFLQASERQGVSVDICIGDEGYQELALYADWLIIADLVVRSVAAPVAVTIICRYIEQRLGKRTETQVKSKLTIQETESERSIQLDYEGPASDYRDVMMEALKQRSGASPQLDPGRSNPHEDTEPEE